MASREGENFIGVFKLKSSDNMDNYLKEVGLNFAIRKIAQAYKPEMTIEIDEEGNWSIVTTTPMKNSVHKFKLGEEKESDAPDGRKLKTSFTLESPNKLVQISKDAKGGEFGSVREIEGNLMKITMQANAVSASRIFERC